MRRLILTVLATIALAMAMGLAVDRTDTDATGAKCDTDQSCYDLFGDEDGNPDR